MSTKSYLRSALFAIATAVSMPGAAADPVAGAAIGAGVGAVAGHAISGRDGALVGGAVGAVTGYQIAKNHHRAHQRRHVAYRSYQRPVYYRQRPARVYQAPNRHYSARPAHYVSRPSAYRGHRHVQYHYDRSGRLVRVTTWR